MIVEAVALAGVTASEKPAVIVGFVGTLVGGIAPFRSIAPAFKLDSPKEVVELSFFLQLETPTKSVIARSNELKINICFLITSFILS